MSVDGQTRCIDANVTNDPMQLEFLVHRITLSARYPLSPST